MTTLDTVVLKGKPVVDDMVARGIARVEKLAASGVIPQIAIVRVGENPDDCSYERMAIKRAAAMGVAVKQFVFAADECEETIADALREINEDATIHGCLMFRPLPRHMSEDMLCEMLAPEKDIDGITSASMAGVYAGSDQGFAPCTAQACVEMLDHYGIDIAGKRVCVVGRSLVIGRPVSLLLMNRNATVTMCHSRTQNLSEVMREADIVVCATGRAKAYGAECFAPHQTLLDVGINFDDEGQMCGDIDYAAVSGKVAAITPVPGGIGGITTAVLMDHVITAAERAVERQRAIAE